MLTPVGPAQPNATSAMGHGTVQSDSMYGGKPSTVTSSASNGATPMNNYHNYSQPNSFPSAYPQSAIPGQQWPSHSAFPGHNSMPQYAYPGHNNLSPSTYPHQEHPSHSAFPGQEHPTQSLFPGHEYPSPSVFSGQSPPPNVFPGQNRPSQSVFPGHEHPSPNVFLGQSLPQNAFPGQNRPFQSVFPGQSPPQNVFPGQPPPMNVFPGQMPSQYSQPKPLPPLIPAPHLQKQLANQQNQLDNKSIIENIYSYPLSKPEENITASKLQDNYSISKPKETDTTMPKEIGSISNLNKSDQKIESTPQKIDRTESEIDYAKPIFVHSKVLEKRKKSVAEVIESVIKSNKTDDSDVISSSIKTESNESFTVPPKKIKPEPELHDMKKTEIPTSTTTEKDNGLKKISITPFAHMDSKAIQKEKSGVLNFFPNKQKYKKVPTPKKTKPKEPNSTPKPSPKPLQPRGTSTRGLRAKAEVNYAVLDDPYDYIKDPDKPKIQPHTTIQGFKEMPSKVHKSPVKKRESSESDKVKIEPSDENGEEKSNTDEVVNQFSDHPLFSILGGEEEWNEDEGETEEPEQSEHIDLSSFSDTGVSPGCIINPKAPRKKAAPVFTSNPTEWGYPEKPDKDYSGKRYQCDYCDYGSNELTNITTHIRGHTGEKPYKCTICNFASSRSNTIKMHMRTHTGEKPFKCDLCEKAFTKSNNLVVHRKTHTGEKDYECSICNDRFITPEQLRKHFRSHTGERPYSCKFCEKAFSDASTLIRHTRTHTGEKPYECDICGKTFSQGNTLKYHRLTHTGEKPYKCNLCPFANILKYRLKNHMIEVHLNNKKKAKRGRPRLSAPRTKCEVEEEADDLEIKIDNDAQEETHTGDKPYKCSMCPKAYIQSCHLKEHMMKDHFAHLAEQAMNDTLEQVEEKEDNLEKKMDNDAQEEKHTGDKPYKCSMCPEAYIESCHLKEHMMKDHFAHLAKQVMNDTQEQVEEKADNLEKKKDYDAQEETHTGDKPYKCSMCPEAYIESCHLKEHMMKDHFALLAKQAMNDTQEQLEEKADNLEKKIDNDPQEEMHTGDKPYKCSMCPEAYIESCHLKEHMMKDHFALLAKQAMNDTQEQMGKQIINELDEPDDTEEMYGSEGYLEEQALEDTLNIFAKVMNKPGSAEDDELYRQVKMENDTDDVGNIDSQTKSEVKTKDNTGDVGNQINEEKPESAKTLYKIKTWKSVKIKKSKYY